VSTFYLTFGGQYAHTEHPTWEGIHPDGWITVVAPDFRTARTLVVDLFGTAWSDLYGEDTFEPRHFPRGELLCITIETRKGPPASAADGP
jgi:hypothetical protein